MYKLFKLYHIYYIYVYNKFYYYLKTMECFIRNYYSETLNTIFLNYIGLGRS